MVPVVLISRARLLVEGIANHFAHVDEISIEVIAEEVEQALTLVHALKSAIVLFDLNMPGGPAGIAEITGACPDAQVIALSAASDDALALGCIRAGCIGVIPEETSLGELAEAVLRVARGEPACAPRIVLTLMEQLRRAEAHGGGGNGAAARLTPRERQVLQLIGAGLSNKEIAHELSISVSTVKNHVHSVLDKLDLKRRSQAVALIGNSGLSARQATG